MTDPDKGGATERTLRAAFVSSQAPGGPSCPDETTLAALAVGELPQPHASSIADHAVTCRRCSATLRDLLDLHEAARPGARVSSRAPWWMAAAAAVLMLAGVSLTYYAWRVSSAPPGNESVDRGAAVPAEAVDPTDGAVLTAAPVRFAWAGQPGAESYWVVLYDAESTPLWESPRSTDPRIPIPNEVRERLREGRYFWRGMWIEGIETSQTPLSGFTISPPRP